MKNNFLVQIPFRGLYNPYGLALAIVMMANLFAGNLSAQDKVCPPPQGSQAFSYAGISPDGWFHPTTLDIAAIGTYTWPQSGLTYTNSGTYTHTRSNASGCSVVDTLKAIIYHPNMVVQPVSCHLFADGSIMVTVTPAPLTLLCAIDGGPFLNNGGLFNGLTPGTHTVCVLIDGTYQTCQTQIVTEPAPLQINLVTTSLVSCLGNDGVLSATITGGTHVISPYLTYWTNAMGILLNPLDNFATSISNLPAGPYYLMVEDDNGCIANASTMLQEAPPLHVIASANQADCYTGMGNVNVTSSGGTPPVTYWVNGLPVQPHYLPGTYNVAAIDSKGCVDNTSVTILPAQPPAITVVSNVGTLCLGSSATLTANGALNYSWTPATGLNTTSGPVVIATPTATAQYLVTGTDAAGCTGTATINLPVVPSSVSYSITVSPPIVPCGGSAMLTANSTVNYCSAGANIKGCTNNHEFISYVQIGSINNPSSCVTGTSQYQNFSALSTNVNAGMGYTITIVNGHSFAGDQVRVWVDWNHNGSFSDANETFAIPYSPTSIGNILVPMTAINGPARMRIRLSGAGVMSSCGATNYGEVEDYTLNVTGGMPEFTEYVWTQSGGSTLSGSITNVETASNINANTTFNVVATPLNGCSSTAQNAVLVSGNCNTTLNLTCFIQGYWAGGGLMAPVLDNQGQPAPPMACDSIDVALHLPYPPFSAEASTRAVLQQNGTALCELPLLSGPYYIVVKHRNALQTWSSVPVPFGPAPVVYNFSTAASQAYGSNQVEVMPGIFALFSGDLNYDENIDLLDMTIMEADISNFVYGYYATDLNGDGNVDLLDSPAMEMNINNFIYSVHP